MKRRFVLVAAAGLLATPWLGCKLHAQDQGEPARIAGVSYGRKGGLDLTLDVFRPKQPNGIGVLWMVSGGWFSGRGQISPQIARPFTDRGQTVFAVVHASRPEYAIADILNDIDRATRFVRANAATYGVDPQRLAISGGSSGCHLSLMQAARGSAGNPNAQDPVLRADSRIQAVAGFYPPTDFLNYGKEGKSALEYPELRPFYPAFAAKDDTMESKIAAARFASPITYVTKEMPPTLLIHGDADTLVPIQQSEVFMKKLETVGVKHQLVVRPGKGHGWPNLLDDVKIIASWFDENLPKKPAN